MAGRYAVRMLTGMIGLGAALMIGAWLPDSVYGQFKPAAKHAIPTGEKGDIKGVLLTRDGETFVLRDVTELRKLMKLYGIASAGWSLMSGVSCVTWPGGRLPGSAGRWCR